MAGCLLLRVSDARGDMLDPELAVEARSLKVTEHCPIKVQLQYLIPRGCLNVHRPVIFRRWSFRKSQVSTQIYFTKISTQAHFI